MLQLVQATKEHAVEIAENLRKEDIDELNASGTLWHKEAFMFCIENDYPVWAAIDEEDGRVAALGGVTPSSHTYVGVPWAVATDAISKHPVGFTRIGRYLMPKMHEHYPFLANWVDARNTKHIRWLKSLGFSFGIPLPYGINGEQFFPFMHVVGAANV
jgi:hypothetical protein